jgi:uncharacterized repeat protein (TIGR01451 family)
MSHSHIASTASRVKVAVSAGVAMLLTLAAVSLGATAAHADSPSISDLTIQTLFDGGSAPNSLDSGQSNNMVATNDTVGFGWTFTAQSALTDAPFTQTLPAGWSWDPSTVTALTSDSSIYQSSAVISADGRTLTATVSTAAGNTVLLKTLVARPDSTVPNLSSYTPQVTATLSDGVSTAVTTPVVVRSQPQANLSKGVVQGPTKLTIGGVDGYSAVYRLTASVPTGAIGSRSGVSLASPLVISDTFTGLDGATASLVSSTSPGVLTQSGDDLSVTISGATVDAATNASADVMLWWPNALVPLAPAEAAVNVSNTATPTNWVAADGSAVVETTTADNTANVSMQRPPTGGSGPAFAKEIYVAKTSSPDFAADPGFDTADWQGVGTNQPVSQGSTIDARFYFHASLNADGTSKGSTNLVAYDFWNPTKQQLIDNGASRFVGDGNNVPVAPSAYTIQYTSGTTTAGPWTNTMAAAGGGSAVSGIRYVIGAEYGTGLAIPQAWLLATAAFTTVGPQSQASVIDTAIWTSDRPADTNAQVGASYIIENTVLGLSKLPNKTTVTSGGTVSYTLQPAVTPPAGSTTTATSGLTVTDTLPANVADLSTSALDPYWGVVRSENAAGQIVLTVTHAGNVTSADMIPPITYTVTTDVKAPSSGSMTNNATLTSGVAAPVAAASNVAVLQANVVTQSKKATFSTIEIGSPVASWDVSWLNYMVSSQGKSYVVDVLPYAGDGRGTSFSGTATLSGAALTASAASGTTVQYTTDAPATVASRLANDPATTWTDLGTIDPSTITGITALRVVITDFAAGDSGTGNLRVTLALNGEKTGDVYGNTSKAYLGNGDRALADTKNATVTVVSSSISGKLVNDANHNGADDSGETGIGGATVHLYNSSSTVVATIASAADGAYTFANIPSGTYTVKVDPASLPAGASETFDHDGSLNNDSGPVLAPTASSVTDIDFGYIVYQSSLQLKKEITSTLPANVVPGTTVDYKFTFTNTGDSPLHNVVLTDALPGLSAIVYSWPGDEGTLTPAGTDGSVATATARYQLTQADIDNGALTNTANVTAVDPVGQTPTATDTVNLALPSNAALSFKKIGTLTGPTKPGTSITWTFTVKNNGNVTVDDVSIKDKLAGLTNITYTWPTAHAGILAPGATMTAKATSLISADEILNGFATNTATVDGTDPTGKPVTNAATAIVYFHLPVVSG